MKREILNQKNYTIENLEQLKKAVNEILLFFSDKELILLSGDLGTGKTQSIQFFLESMGGSKVSSPSFAIHNQYTSKMGLVDHVDLYRLEDEADLESTGFWDLFSKEKGFIFVEWGDRLNKEFLPSHWPFCEIQLSFENGSQEKRNLKFVQYK